MKDINIIQDKNSILNCFKKNDLITARKNKNITEGIIKDIFIENNILTILFSDSKTYNLKNVFDLKNITLIDGGFIENINKITFIKKI